jgi:glycerol-3-phosphate dehydrogenase (NAD(P)+)
MIVSNLDTTRVAIIGPGRLGTSFAYKLGRDNKRVAIYYHNSDVCKAINRDHLNPIHLTEDLAKRLGGMDQVPRLSPKVYATNDLEHIVENNDFIVLSVTMTRLPELLNYLKPMIDKKAGDTCLISPIKGLIADEKSSELMTPSQLIHNHLYNLEHKCQVACIGGPFFDVDIALGKPVCLTVAGNRRTANMIRDDLLMFNRKELNAY